MLQGQITPPNVQKKKRYRRAVSLKNILPLIEWLLTLICYNRHTRDTKRIEGLLQGFFFLIKAEVPWMQMKSLSKYRRLLQSIQAVLANSRRKSKLKIKEKIWLNSTRVMCYFISTSGSTELNKTEKTTALSN